MTLRTLLAVGTVLVSAPALAAMDPPAASSLDAHMRVVRYNPDNPVEIRLAIGGSIRIRLGAGEEVVRVIVSDQSAIAPEDDVPAPSPGMVSSFTNVAASQGQAVANSQAQKGPPGTAYCDANLCRDVAGNYLYLKPLRPLDQQPLFVQTRRCDQDGRCEPVPYTFVLMTVPGDMRTAVMDAVWDVSFVYPDRERAAHAAEAKKRAEAAAAAWRERQALRPAPPSTPTAVANWRYGYQGSAAVQPDQAWDDGRTTFLRFNGNRRVPNVYRVLPDKHESIPAYASEPDATGTTLRIARTEAKWFLRDGDEAGCLFNVGPDPEGRTTTTVAAVPQS